VFVCGREVQTLALGRAADKRHCIQKERQRRATLSHTRAKGGATRAHLNSGPFQWTARWMRRRTPSVSLAICSFGASIELAKKPSKGGSESLPDW